MISDGCHSNRKLTNTHAESRLAVAGAWVGRMDSVYSMGRRFLGDDKNVLDTEPCDAEQHLDVLNVTAFT